MLIRVKQAIRKKYSRAIQTSWYKSYPWISVCTAQYKIFCVSCRSANDQGLLTFSKRSNLAFIQDGFSNWKKALQKFQEHEASSMHREATLKLAAKSTGVRVDTQLSTQLKMDQEHHRRMFLKVLHCIQFLTRQGLPLRGHKEDEEHFGGNLYQLLLLQAKSCPELLTWLRQKDYISPEIVNEVIKIMGQCVLRKILADIRTSLWYAIIADEATDVCHNEQMSLSIRWVDQNYNIHEDTLGLIQLPNTRAETIYLSIKDLLIRCSLPITQCRGQAFDGASNMSGIKNGVQALFKKETDKALYVHCLAHSLNLCLKDVAKTCNLMRDIMNFIFELTQLIKMSPKRLTLFETLRKEVTISTGELTPHLRMLCPTRWTVRHASISSILRNYATIQSALEEIACGHDEYASKASGMVSKMENFDTFFSLKLAYLIFSAAEQLAINLQAKDTTVQEAVGGGQLLASHYKSLRNEDKFNYFYDQVVADSHELTSEPSLPRKRKVPRKINDGASPHEYRSPRERHRHLYFEVTELTAGEVERRFVQPDIQLISAIESTILEFSNNTPTTSLPASLQTYLNEEFDLEKLKLQLSMIPDVLRTATSGVKEVTNVRTVAMAMSKSEIYKGMLQEVDKLLKLYFTFPVTTATAERSFSSLRYIKTYLRSTMTSSRLNNLFLLYIHKERTDSLDLHKIGNDFVNVNNRRQNYFGRF